MRFLKALVALFFVIVILGGAAAGYGWFWVQNEVAKPGPAAQETSFTVERGEGLASVADRLEADGLVVDKRVLRFKARMDGVESDIKAGSYMVHARASVDDILAQLVEGDVIQFRLTIPEGLTTAQILRRVEAATDLTGDMPDREFAEGVFGVEAAAQHYFGVEPSKLSALQAARLAAILPSPKRRSASKPTGLVRKRTKQILDGAETIRRDGRASCFES